MAEESPGDVESRGFVVAVVTPLLNYAKIRHWMDVSRLCEAIVCLSSVTMEQRSSA
jgi:hypothetical protein